MNAIYQVVCYKHKGFWVFDDPKRGIVKEALIAGTDKAIDILTQNIRYAKHGFVLSFSATFFPGTMLSARFTSKDSKAGYWYYVTHMSFPMWLCPVLDQYFETPPEMLHASASELPTSLCRELKIRVQEALGL